VEAIVMAIVMITHSYCGYNASGGPVGVGEAVGRSMRFSPISVVVVPLFAVLALYGVNPKFALTV
jgi:phospholipid/cholesterol/gamma-HCH transport system permease protein